MAGSDLFEDETVRGAALVEASGDRIGTARFLLRYFKRYLPAGALAVVGAISYAVFSIFIFVVFQAILSDVLMTDEGVDVLMSGGLGAPVEAPVEDTSNGPEVGPGDHEPETTGLGGRLEEWLGIDLNLKQLLAQTYEWMKQRAGIDESEVVGFVAVLLVVVLAGRSLSQFANGYFFQVIGLGGTNELRNDLYQRILHQSSTFYAEHPSGELVSRIGGDIAVIQNAISNRLVDLFQQAPVLVVLIWYLFSFDGKLTLFCLVVLPAVAFVVARFGKGMRRTSHQSQERLADLSNLVAEAVRGHRVVKAFGMEDFELSRFREATARHLRVRLRAQLLSYASSPVVEILVGVGVGAIVIYAGQAVREGRYEPSDLVLYIGALLALYDPLRKLNKVNLIVQEGLAAAARVKSVMEAPRDVEDSGTRELPVISDAIHYDGVSFGYKEDRAVLRGIDLSIPRGQLVAFVGPSGAGKSTLVNLLPRFFDPSKGAVRIDGRDVREVSLKSLRAQIGIVTQETMLFNDSIRANIAYGRADLPLERVREAARAAHADDFIMEEGGYEMVIGESGVKLSGGQRQRLAIARALLKDPPILILDEATSHLDSESEALVQDALERLMQGRTALVIAHRLSTIQRADRILVMDEGKVVEEGTHTELLQRGGVYQRLHDHQFHATESARSDQRSAS